MKGYYSIVQYCPILGRRECCNIGIIFLIPEQNFLDIKINESNDRIGHIFGKIADQDKHLSGIKLSFKNSVIKLYEEYSSKGFHFDTNNLESFRKSLANSIIITKPKSIPMRFDSEKMLMGLFDELVTFPPIYQPQEEYLLKLKNCNWEC